MNEKIIDTYCKLVEKHLICHEDTKTRLLSGLKSELINMNYPDEMSLEQLKELYGAPENIAEQFRDAISDNEFFKAQETISRRKRKNIVIASVILGIVIILLAVLITLIIKGSPAYEVTEITPGIPGETFSINPDEYAVIPTP